VNELPYPCPPLAIHHFRTHEVIEIDPEDIESCQVRETDADGQFVVLKMKTHPVRELPVREDWPTLIVILAKLAEHVATMLLWQFIRSQSKL